MNEIEKIFAPAVSAPSQNATTPDAVAGVPHSFVAEKSEGENAETPSMSALARYVTDHMRINYDARSKTVDARLRYGIQSQTCSYNEEQKGKMRSIGIGERVYSPVTATKVRSVYAMLMELSQYGSDVPFEITPTPDPEVPLEIENQVLAEMKAEIEQLMSSLERSGVQKLSADEMVSLQSMIVKLAETRYDRVENAKETYASSRARRLQKRIWDLMIQGGYEKAYQKCLEDFCTYGTCVMCGPVMKNVAHNKSFTDKKSGVRKIRRVISSIPTYERISPVDCYPSPDAEEITDGVLCVRVRYVREELWRFKKSSSDKIFAKGEEGWIDSAITKLLAEHEFGCRLNEFPSDRVIEDAERKEINDAQCCKFEGIRCFAYIDGSKLLELGITRSLDGIRIKSDDFYYCETIVIGGRVVFCRIYDERVGMPLCKSVFYSVPGSWWGESIADKLYSTQSIMNNAIVSLLRNMGPASSSMMWMKDVSRLVDKSPTGLMAEPGKIYAFNSGYPGQMGHDSGVPMGVLQIPSNAAELLNVAKWATNQADIDSGIPAFSEGVGGSNGGALRTAEGLRTFTEHSTRGVKATARHLDAGIVCGTAKLTADWILVYDDDMNLKGDVEVKSVGLMGKILKAQNDQFRMQLFNMCLNSQLMQNILGVKGMLALFRPSLVDTNINPDDVIPSKERMEMLEEFERVKELAQAASAEATVNEASAEGGGGMSPGVSPVEMPKGGVESRRDVA